MKKLVLFVCFIFIASLMCADGLEDFTNSNATSSYTDNSFVGNGSITWTYVQSRNGNGDANGSGISLPALMLRRLSSGSKITSSTISGGIGNFSVKLYKGFTGGGDRQVELFINSVSKGTSVAFDDYDEHTFTVENINVTGDIIIEITNITEKQIIIDDISWTSYSGGGPPALIISNLAREYKVPTAAQTCSVSCDITGGTPPYTAVIKYDVDGVSQSDISMSSAGGDSYSGILPVQSDGARVEYYIDVTDNAKANVTSSTYGLFWGTSPISNAAGNIREVDGNGVLVYDGYYARITGIATVASGIYSTSNLDVYLQDSDGGINLFKYSSTVSITAGNSYTAFGVLDQYNGKAELIPDDASTDITDNGAGTMPSPTIITIAQFLANPEYYEGMLIGIQHLSKVSGTWPSSGSDANLVMTDDGGTSEITLRVDKDTDIDENTEPAWPKDVVGIASQYDYSSPYDTGYQIIPRAYTDFWDDGTLPVELSSFTASYANEFVTIEWATASETDVHGFNIYRAREDNLEDADQVNMSLIPGHGTTTQPNEYSFTDVTADAYFTTYYYWLEAVNYGGTTDIYGSIQYDPVDIDGDGQLNTIFRSTLDAVFPNPVKVGENITFKFMIGGLEGTMRPVSLNIYNIKGGLVKEVINEEKMVDDYTETWRVNDMANGVYFYQLKTENYQETKKLLIQ